MRIEVWSDVICPWCYIGKRRLERAVADFPEEVELVWRSFQLDPGAPTVPREGVAEHLGRKYGGGPDAGRAMIDNVEAVAAGEGLDYRLHQAQRVNTMDAHRLIQLAGDSGHQSALTEALMAAYFTETRNIADHVVLREIALAVGLDPIEVDGVLGSDRYRDAVEADIAQAAAYGSNGVPFFVFDGAFAVSGAQPSEVFRQALDRAHAAAG
jgi:predicted DsbA family dithiol-disulfide isomerase